MSSHVVDTSTSDEDEEEDPRVAFFKQLKVGFELVEENCKDESYSYTPIGQIVMAFASACKASDKESTVLGAIQHTLKKPDNTVRSPDFASLRVSPKLNTTETHTDRRQRDAIKLWEVRTLPYLGWFSLIESLRNDIVGRAQGQFKSYLRQLNEQALFAFYQYPGDVVPVFLSQGNCFTLLLYPRPSNWDTIAVKYRDTLESDADQSPATGQPEPGTSHAASPPEQDIPVRQEEAPAAQEHIDDAVAPAARITGKRPARDTSPDPHGQETTQTTEEVPKEAAKELAASVSDASPSTSTDTTEFLFEEGDLPIALVIFFCEFILLPDGSGFTPQFLHALLAAMSFSDIKFKSSDRIFADIHVLRQIAENKRLEFGDLQEIWAKQAIEQSQVVPKSSGEE
ncbi:hypothetical protein EWM64_g8772 [Hericium alpestre]|uniref:Uncharacterized protein n=1 Tax=Hericium alpestre TaxID=135208 RepID=A0A4Y9ZN21_9AGAM|nr:hypothetical protein EWM64_g8772 [Hericium alpestre]